MNYSACYYGSREVGGGRLKELQHAITRLPGIRDCSQPVIALTFIDDAGLEGKDKGRCRNKPENLDEEAIREMSETLLVYRKSVNPPRLRLTPILLTFIPNPE